MSGESIQLEMSSGIVRREQVTIASGIRLVHRTDAAVSSEDSQKKIDAASFDRPSSAQLELEALQSEAAALRAELQELSRLATQKEEVAYVRGLEAGRVEGKKLAQDHWDARVAALKSGVETAISGLDDAFQRLESAAGHLAVVATEQIVGDDDATAHNVKLVLRHQLVQMRVSKPLSIRVSPQDFPDLDSLKRELASCIDSIDIELDKDLPAGGCRFQLGLGEVDAGIQQQLNALRAILKEAAQ